MSTPAKQQQSTGNEQDQTQQPSAGDELSELVKQYWPWGLGIVFLIVVIILYKRRGGAPAGYGMMGYPPMGGFPPMPGYPPMGPQMPGYPPTAGYPPYSPAYPRM